MKPIPLCMAALIAGFGAGSAAAADFSTAPLGPNGLMTFPNVRVVNAPQLATAPARGTVQPGLRAYIDPATGMLRGPTDEELQQESASALRAEAFVGPAADAQFVTASGAIGVALGESSMMFSVVQKADGAGLNEFCVVGPETALKLLSVKAPASAALNRKEVRNDR
jgi:hypothetical protein